jgi:hypothetical protein
LFSAFILFSCVNKEEEIQKDILELKKELQINFKEDQKLYQENLDAIEFKFRKKRQPMMLIILHR